MYIEAIMWYFGMDKHQATDYYLKCINHNEQSSLEQILQAYKNQAQLSFYND